jgi:hypothetical protein
LVVQAKLKGGERCRGSVEQLREQRGFSLRP